MTLPYVKIAHSLLTPTEVKIYCNSVTPDWRNNIDVKPNANGTSAVEVNTLSFENPKYQINGIHFILADTNSLQFSQLQTLSKIKYDGTNAPVLKVHYGNSPNDTDLVASDGVTTNIKVIVENWTFPIDVTQSKNGYMPIINLTLRETA
jgi:hypothetical protein